MNKKELELAAKLLAAEMFDNTKKALFMVAEKVMHKFDRGPKPRLDEKVNIVLNVEIEAPTLYKIQSIIRNKG